MKNILCFGDSNTFGYDGENEGARFPRDVCWTGRLQKLLGDDYFVIEEGLSGRTIVNDDPVTGRMSGISYLPACLESHRPIDLVIFMLGTNDLKNRFSMSPGEVGRAAQRAVKLIQNSECGRSGEPEILLVAPVEGKRVEMESDPYWPWSTNSVQDMTGKNVELSEVLMWTAQYTNTHFASVCDDERFPTNNVDGIHLTPEGHSAVADFLAQKVREIL